jgi:UDP-N-acetylmuramate--alanine ligase
MRGIARLLLARGIAVSGSDLKDSAGLAGLREAGAAVHVGHDPRHLQWDPVPDAVVISTAIADGNPELRAATARGIPVYARAQILAALMRGRRTIAVSGTHGKTTTTSMIAVILERLGRDPTFVIGGDLNESGSGARHGGGEWFVAEADESDGSFLLLEPDVAVATNVADDHLNFYRGGEEIRAAFASFFASAPVVVTCGDDPGARECLALAGRDALTYGVDPSNAVRVRIDPPDGDGARGAIEVDGRWVRIRLRVRPPHNVLNAAAAVVAAMQAGIEADDAALALRSFTGARRRFEFRGVAHGAEFFDDYAVHPTEVRAVLSAVPEEYGRIIAVFQPHRYSRVQSMWRALGQSLDGADVVVVTDVYGASEEPVPGVTGKLVVDAAAESAPGKRIVYLPRRSDVAEFLAGEIRHGDFVVTLGAGDITFVADETIDRILEAP